MPSAASDKTTSAVNHLDPLAMASRVSTIIATSCARWAQPAERSSTVSPARSTRITPEKRVSVISASIRAAKPSMLMRVDDTPRSG